ncbi:MAG: M3 family oligoendopeptidase [Actinomycetota bacterium]|nr:M3 family oligoendopeptidase [Actinomycetota bacterium]
MTAAATSQDALPRWDLTPIFPDLESPEFEEEFGELLRELERLASLFDERGIAAERGGAAADTAADVFDEVTERLNALLERHWTIFAYLTARVAADSRDDAAQARLSALRRHEVGLTKLRTRFVEWVAALDDGELLTRSETARRHAFMVRRAREAARRLMSPPEEDLAAELAPAGPTAWTKLHVDVTSQLVVDVEVRGEKQKLPMSEVRMLAHDRDRGVRRAAYEGELRTWEATAVPLAAALNSVKGHALVLAERRGWQSPLEQALFDNQIDAATLEALLEAVTEALPGLRRYLATKARALNLPALAWFDLFAPLPPSPTGGGNGRREWDFGTARAFILEQFGAYSTSLRDLADHAFANRWIDAEPRAGKRDGAFCLPIRPGESRILSNFRPSFSAMATLAHELGHGYHNLVTAELTPLQRQIPMTAAETASIFCQTVVKNAALRTASSAERLEILEGSLEANVQMTLDILSRFLFERRLLERRRERELSVSELCELMLEAQRETYADGVQGDLHAYMWAVKPHYYFTSFYNFPYTFGLLFGLGLHARYEADPERFRPRYDALLASTGLDDVASLAARLDVDVRSPDFWRESLAVIRDDIDLFEEVVTGRDTAVVAAS